MSPAPNNYPTAPAGAVVTGEILAEELEAASYDPDGIDPGEETANRKIAQGLLAVQTGNLRLSYFTARKTETITKVGVITGAVAAAATPTLIRLGVYLEAPDTSLTLVASTPNDTTLLAAASFRYLKSFSAPLAKVRGARYAVGLLVVSGVALPQVYGLVCPPTADTPHTARQVGSLADLPASIASGAHSASAGFLYAALQP